MKKIIFVLGMAFAANFCYSQTNTPNPGRKEQPTPPGGTYTGSSTSPNTNTRTSNTGSNTAPSSNTNTSKTGTNTGNPSRTGKKKGQNNMQNSTQETNYNRK